MPDHHCNSGGPKVPVVDESGVRPLTLYYPTCTECGKPQVFGSLLANLPTGTISTANLTLPACRADSPEFATAGVEVPDLGLVLITFKKFRSKHHKTRLYFWTPEKAELG